MSSLRDPEGPNVTVPQLRLTMRTLSFLLQRCLRHGWCRQNQNRLILSRYWEGEDFIAENITFENSSPEVSGKAVIVRVTADPCAFYNCRFLGWQKYRYFGPGFCPSKRVKWARELMDKEAEQFLMQGFVDPAPQRPWLAQRMALRIPYSG